MGQNWKSYIDLSDNSDQNFGDRFGSRTRFVESLGFGKFLLGFFCAILIVFTSLTGDIQALEAITLSDDDKALELNRAIEIKKGEKGKIEIQTVADSEGIVHRLEISSNDENRVSYWALFALKNNTDSQIERLIVAPHFKLAGSGISWPDLGSNRIRDITPSIGFPPEREGHLQADVFSITLNPGSVATFAAELHGDNDDPSRLLPQLQLWEPTAYKDYTTRFTLFNGIVIGIAGLLALFLSILFVVKGGWMFPAVASLAWAVLLYLCIDFGFLQQLIKSDPMDRQTYRAFSEVFLSSSLFLFLFAYLRLHLWNKLFLQLGLAMGTLCLVLIISAFISPQFASSSARILMGITGIVGLVLISILALKRYHRAIMMIPSWTLYCGWLLLSALTLSDIIGNDMGHAALAGGLMIILLLFSFTVLQHAFSSDATISGLLSDAERKALAFTGGGDLIWDWDVTHDKVFTPINFRRSMEIQKHVTSVGSISNWLALLHQDDQDLMRKALEAVIEVGRGRISQDCRILDKDGNHRTFRINARPILDGNDQVLRIIGKMEEITDTKNAIERYLHDAVHDYLTGLPNRQLFIDRLNSALSRSKAEKTGFPVIYLINIDRFREVNESVGSLAGDHILINIADRILKCIAPYDTLARVNGDQFALMTISQKTSKEVADLASKLTNVLKKPIVIKKKELFLTNSIGVVAYDANKTAEDYLKDADLAVMHAKKLGGDRVEAFRHSFRARMTDFLSLESDLRRALERDELTINYQAIYHASSTRLAGMEALVRWDHPVRGRIMPDNFIGIAERSGLIIDLGNFVINNVCKQIKIWEEVHGFGPDMFVSINISSRHFMGLEFVKNIGKILKKTQVNPGNIVLEMTETLVMENPEKTTYILKQLRDLGIAIALDDFGAGYSSLSYLQYLPLNIVKTDRQFLMYKGAGANYAILRAITLMAHELGFKVIAEGVETENDFLSVLQLGCDMAQGYHFSRPMNVSDVDKIFQQAKRDEPAA